MDILILTNVFEYENLTCQFWIFLFKLKKSIWSKNWYLNFDYYFGIENYILILKLIDWVLKVFSTSVIHNKSLL